MIKILLSVVTDDDVGILMRLNVLTNHIFIFRPILEYYKTANKKVDEALDILIPLTSHCLTGFVRYSTQAAIETWKPRLQYTILLRHTSFCRTIDKKK